ncbi:unnamed protein product [Caenorhabditis nigoni]
MKKKENEVIRKKDKSKMDFLVFKMHRLPGLRRHHGSFQDGPDSNLMMTGEAKQQRIFLVSWLHQLRRLHEQLPERFPSLAEFQSKMIGRDFLAFRMHQLPGPRGHHDSFRDLPDSNSGYRRSKIAQTPSSLYNRICRRGESS